MTEAAWAKLKDLFREASTLDAAARAAFVARVRAESAAVARELEALLAPAGPSVTEVVARGAAEVGARRDVIGRRFGAYRIVEHVAHGGMGDVYIGERDDGAFDQRVAVKLIAAGLFADDALRRFRVEQQILAKLEHPNIARILDGGTTEHGIAYLVMEYVEGTSIDEFCARERWPLRRRLDLFQAVCSALEYAHRNLIVHRDIKPSNILVTVGGMPKLLDFGIAKLLDAELPAADATQRALTPDYASPEQILGTPITTASDVYSLGVLLYVLLAGRKPYATRGLRPSDLERVVCETVPVKPSAAASPDSLEYAWRKSLVGDLDNIVLKALAKEPAHRYAGVHELSADVRRYLDGLPVEARGRSLAYVARKFVARNSGAVAVATAVVSAGAAGLLYHTQSITAERDRVRAEAGKAAAVAGFLESIFRVSDPDEAQGATITAKEILDTGARRLDAELADQPETRATLSNTIGNVYEHLGLFDEARAQLAEAVRLREAAGDQAGLAESLSGLGYVLFELGELEESRAHYERALAINRARLPADHLDIAASIDDVAHVIYQQGDFAGAVTMYEDGLAMMERLGATEDEHYADALHDLGQVKQMQGELDSAESLLRRAYSWRLGHAGERNTFTLIYMHDLASVLQERARFTEAEALFKRVIALEAQLLGENHPDRDAAMTNLGRLYADMGRLADAEAYTRQAYEFSARVRGPRHEFTAYDEVNLANLLTTKGEYAEARRLFAEALSIYAETLDAAHPLVASAKVGHAALLNLIGEPELAAAEAREARAIAETALPAGHWLAASAQSALGEAFMLEGDLDAAEPLLVDAYPVIAEARPRDRVTVNALRRLVELYARRGDAARAAAYGDKLAALDASGQ